MAFSAQYPASRQLSTIVDVKAGLQRPEGMSFEVFGKLSSIEFAVTVVNDSPDAVTFPPSFTNDVSVRVERAGVTVPSDVSWRKLPRPVHSF